MILIHQRYRQTDRRTDRQTDGQHAISIPRYALVHRAVKIAQYNSIAAAACRPILLVIDPDQVIQNLLLHELQSHNLQLSDHANPLADSKFIMRMLIENVY